MLEKSIPQAMDHWRSSWGGRDFYCTNQVLLLPVESNQMQCGYEGVKGKAEESEERWLGKEAGE